MLRVLQFSLKWNRAKILHLLCLGRPLHVQSRCCRCYEETGTVQVLPAGFLQEGPFVSVAAWRVSMQGFPQGRMFKGTMCLFSCSAQWLHSTHIWSSQFLVFFNPRGLIRYQAWNYIRRTTLHSDWARAENLCTLVHNLCTLYFPDEKRRRISCSNPHPVGASSAKSAVARRSTAAASHSVRSSHSSTHFRHGSVRVCNFFVKVKRSFCLKKNIEMTELSEIRWHCRRRRWLSRRWAAGHTRCPTRRHRWDRPSTLKAFYPRPTLNHFLLLFPKCFLHLLKLRQRMKMTWYSWII